MKAVTVLQKICLIYGIFPLRNNIINYIYSSLLILLNLAVLCFVIYDSLSIDHYQNIVVIIPILASDIILVVSLIVAITYVNLINGKMMQKFSSKCSKLKPTRKYGFSREFYTANVLYLMYSLYNFSFVRQFFNDTYVILYAYKTFQNYGLCLMHLLLRYYAMVLYYLFLQLNEQLKRIGKRGASLHLQMIFNKFKHLRLLIATYNQIFGVLFIVQYIFIMTNFLVSLNMLTYFRKDGDSAFFPQLMVLCFIWACFPTVLEWLLLSACQKIFLERQRTIRICCQKFYNVTCVREKRMLYDMSCEVSNREYSFTAAGFFDVNYNIVGSLLTNTFTYLIVLIQFH